MTLLRSAVIAAAGMALSFQGAAHAGGGVSINSYGQRALLIGTRDGASCGPDMGKVQAPL